MKRIVVFLLAMSALCALNAGMLNLDNPFSPEYPAVQPDTATNLQMYSFSNMYAIDTPILYVGVARCGKDNTDTLYTGTFRLLAYEDNDDASVFSFNLAGTDTTDVFNLNNGECYFYMENPDTEMIALRIEDTLGNLKPSFFSTIEFKGRADTATCMKGFEDSVMLVDFPATMFIRFEDDSNRIFPDYASLMTDSTMKVKVLNPDPDFVIASMGSSSSDSLYPLIINGGYYLQFGPQTIGSFDVVFEPLLASPPVPPETITIQVMPPEESPLLIVFSADGYNQTEGMDRTLLMMNMADDGPRSDNNTSQVLCEAFDLAHMGVTLDPTDTLTLNSGTAQLNLSCDSINDCIILKTTTLGTPQLYNITKYRPIEFKSPGLYTRGKAFGPLAAAAGDTITYYIRVMDAYDTIDTSYKGLGYLTGDPTDMEIINGYSDFIDRYPEIENGVGQFRMSYPYVDRNSTYFTDGEGDFTNNYYATSGFDGQELVIEWMEGSNSVSPTGIEIVLPEGSMIKTGREESFSVVALKDDTIATSYNSILNVTHDGTGITFMDTINIVNGVGTGTISDSIAETVEIIANDGTFSDSDTIYFVSGTEAAFIVVAGPKTSIASEDFSLTFFAMTGGFTLDTTYTGILTLEYEDTTGDTMSLYSSEDLSSINIINGSANVDFSNADIERLDFSGYAVSGADTISMENFELMTTGYVHPVYDPVIEHPEDTIYLHTIDYDSVLVAYNTEIDSLVINEAIDDSSFEILGDTTHIPVVDGVALIRVTDPDEETVRIYGEYYDEFLEDNYTYRLLFQFTTHNGITGSSHPEKFYFSSRNSLSNSTYVFNFGTPVSQHIRLNIYDKTGRLLNTLANGTYVPGDYMSVWDGRDFEGNTVPAGTYFAYIRTDNELKSEKIILIK